jgi:hypothetical protein
VGVISFSSAYIMASQPKNNNTNNSLNSSNNSNSNITTNKTSQIQNQTKKQIITEDQAVNIYKKEFHINSDNRYVATLIYMDGKPYYEITIIDKKTGESSTSPGAVNAITGDIDGPD